VTYCGNDDRVLIFVKYYAPIADPKPHAIASLQALDIAMPSIGELGQPLIKPVAYLGR